MKLWIGNIAPGTTEQELSELLHKYGAPAHQSLLQVPGDGSHPGVLLTYDASASVALHHLVDRLHGVYWKHRGLNVHLMHH